MGWGFDENGGEGFEVRSVGEGGDRCEIEKEKFEDAVEEQIAGNVI